MRKIITNHRNQAETRILSLKKGWRDYATNLSWEEKIAAIEKMNALESEFRKFRNERSDKSLESVG